MTRTMFDGVDATRLPTTAHMVAGYVDGLYKWSTADWARFPNAVKVRIACFSDTNDGHVLDCEPGNATPAQSVDWVLLRRRAGVDPTVYMNTSTWDVVRAAFQARGVAEPHYWVAQYDGRATIPAGAIGKQYVNDETHGWDLSAITDHWPGIDPPPEAEVPLTPQDVAAILNQPIARAGGPNGNTSLAGLAAWNDTHTQRLVDAINTQGKQLGALTQQLAAAQGQLGKLATGGVDLAQLEALIEQHLAAGSVPGVIAAAVLQHLSNATADAKP